MKINASQVLILKALASGPREGMSRDDLIAVLPERVAVSYKTIGGYTEPSPSSLHGRGLVVALDVGDENDQRSYLWQITTKGRQLAQSMQATPPVPSAERIPNPVLDTVVKKFRTTRTYGFEAYTDADIAIIRDTCGAQYSHIATDSIRHHITNRRKERAFVDPAKSLRIAVTRTIRDFGPNGAYASVLTDDQVQQLRDLLP